MTPADKEALKRALNHAITRCSTACRNLNSQTYGHETGGDCSRKIEDERKSIVEEALKFLTDNNSTTGVCYQCGQPVNK